MTKVMWNSDFQTAWHGRNAPVPCPFFDPKCHLPAAKDSTLQLRNPFDWRQGDLLFCFSQACPRFAFKTALLGLFVSFLRWPML